jgi:methyltransferase (TIGR00027 family)
VSRRSAVEQTALGPMVIAACERFTPPEHRLVDDDLAGRLLPAGEGLAARACRWSWVRRLLVSATERQACGLWGSMLCRKRYIDDRVGDALTAGIDQLVVLGAGLDTRSHRLARPAGARAFEVDLPTTVADKQRRVHEVLGEQAGEVVHVPLDLGAADLLPALVERGFAPDRPAVVVWEAVTQYLDEAGVRRTLDGLRGAAAGSRLLFTYVRGDFLDGTRSYGAAPLLERMGGPSGIWRFGLVPDAVGPLLAEFGWSALDDVGPADYQQRYPELARRRMPVSEIERCVHAAKG